MNKKLISGLLTGILALSLTACGGSSSDNASSSTSEALASGGSTSSSTSLSESNTSASGEKVDIVIMPKVVGIEYYNAVKEGVDEAAEELSDVANIKWQGPTEATVDAQIEMLETIIPTHPDVICIAANDANALEPTIEKAEEAGIKVVSWDSDTTKRDIFVNLVDYTEFGNAIIDSMAEQIDNEGEIAIITTSLTATNQNKWIEAIKNRIETNYPNIEIVDTREAGEDTQKANTLASDLMKSYPDLKGIIALGTPNVPGVVDAVKSANKVGEVIVCGNTTPNTIRSYIKEGSIRDVELWSAPDHGYLTVYTAYRLATDGLAVGESFDAGRMGEYTPEEDDISMSISLPLVIINKDNVDDYDF